MGSPPCLRMPTLLLTHSACLLHDTGQGHPERADRLRAIDDALAGDAFARLKREQAPRADLATIDLVHPHGYTEAIHAAMPERGLAWLDPDTVVSPQSFEAALRAAGAAIYAVDQVVTGAAQNAFCSVRPPGQTTRTRGASVALPRPTSTRGSLADA